MDDMVVRAQRFVNSYNVSGIPKIAEDGITGWATMRALTRVLQHELGITTLSDTFGPATLSALQSQHPSVNGSTSKAAIVRVLQSAFYCKGYDGGNIDGIFNSRTSTSAASIKSDMGLAVALPGPDITPKVFKACLTMDAYVIVGAGVAAVGDIQRWMNGRYLTRRNFHVVPCDGIFSRDVHKAFLYCIQYEIGMSDDVANGTFGPGTKDGLRRNEVDVGSPEIWARLFTAAMVFNRRPVAWAGAFTSATAEAVRRFQEFTRLPLTSRGDYQTWASLLVSCGDNTRAGTACDTITAVTASRAATLHGAGYRHVGRYLTNAPVPNALNKQIQNGELDAISQAGLSVFPIYQTFGNSASRFSSGTGQADAFHAIDRLRNYGFRAGTRVYFAVDFDALDYEVTDFVLPYFNSAAFIFSGYAPEYLLGVYGPRNVCARVAAAGHTTASFVSDMSTGFSGNLGFPLPTDWAFDQIATRTVGVSPNSIEIDNNIASGRDLGQTAFDPPQSDAFLDVEINFPTGYESSWMAELKIALEAVETPETGGPEEYEFTIRSNTESIGMVAALDKTLTEMARVLRFRKALMQAPLLWEIRKYNREDQAAEAAIQYYHNTGIGPRDDCSVGVAQIIGRVAIRAMNYCRDNGITSGDRRYRDPEDLEVVWTSMLASEHVSVQTMAKVLIQAAADVAVANGGPVRRPALDYTEDESRKVMARYNGTNAEADNYGQVMLGLYRVFEKYNAQARPQIV